MSIDRRMNKEDTVHIQGFPGDSVVKESDCNAGDAGDIGVIPGLGRFPGGRHGNPIQYSFAWRIPWTEESGSYSSEVAKSQTRLKTLSTAQNSIYTQWNITWPLKRMK